MAFWIPIVVVLVARVIIGVCAVNISKCGGNDSNLLRDAHGIEMFAIYVLVIHFLQIPLVHKILFWFMVACAAWGVVQFIASLFARKEDVRDKVHWILARFLGLVAMAFTVYWASTIIF